MNKIKSIFTVLTLTIAVSISAFAQSQNVSLPSLDGETVSLNSQKGKVIVLALGASWGLAGRRHWLEHHRARDSHLPDAGRGDQTSGECLHANPFAAMGRLAVAPLGQAVIDFTAIERQAMPTRRRSLLCATAAVSGLATLPACSPTVRSLSYAEAQAATWRPADGAPGDRSSLMRELVR